MAEIKIAEEEAIKLLKEKGYRILKLKPKEKKEFKPIKALQHSAFGGVYPVIIIRETPKFFEYKPSETAVMSYKAPKSEFFEFDEEILNKVEEFRKKERELNKQISKLRSELWDFVNERLKPIVKE